MQGKLGILGRRWQSFVIVFAFALLILLAFGTGFWRAEPSESKALVDPFGTLVPTRTPGPTTTPPFPPPPPPPALSTLIAKAPQPTSLATLTPFPTRTPLPTVVPGRQGAHWAENLTFGPPAPLGKDLRDGFGHIEWSPDGNQLAISLFNGEWIRDKAGKPLWKLTWITLVDRTGRFVAPLTQGFHPYWSPDAAHIAYLAYIGTLDPLYIRVVNVQTKQVIEVVSITGGGVFPLLAWLSASELAFYYKDQPVVFDIRSHQTRPLLDANLLAQTDRSFPLRVFTAVPAKNVLAVGSGRQILLLRWTNGAAQLIRRIDEGLDFIYMVISPDGDLLAYVSLSRQLKIVGVYDKNIYIEFPGNRYAPSIGNWSPDSKSLLYHDSGGTKIVNRDGSGLREIPNVSAFWPPIWSPRGEQITWIDGDQRLNAAAATRQR